MPPRTLKGGGGGADRIDVDVADHIVKNANIAEISPLGGMSTAFATINAAVKAAAATNPPSPLPPDAIKSFIAACNLALSGACSNPPEPVGYYKFKWKEEIVVGGKSVLVPN